MDYLKSALEALLAGMSETSLGLGLGAAAVVLTGIVAILIVASALRGRAARQELASEIALYRRRYAMASGHLRFVRRASSSLKSLPPFMFEAPSFGGFARPTVVAGALPVEARSSADEIVEALADSLNSNIGSAIAITDFIIEADLDKDSERKTIASKIKKEAGKLDAAFWGRHGKAIEGSGLPGDLKNEIKRFYEQVSRLKSDAGKLPGSPSTDDILKVGMEAVEILQTAATMYDIIERSR